MKKFAFLIIFLVFLIDLGDAQIGHHIGGSGESIHIVQATRHFPKIALANIIPHNSFNKPVQSAVPIPTLGLPKPPREYRNILAGASGGLPS